MHAHSFTSYNKFKKVTNKQLQTNKQLAIQWDKGQQNLKGTHTHKKTTMIANDITETIQWE